MSVYQRTFDVPIGCPLLAKTDVLFWIRTANVPPELNGLINVDI